MIIFETFLKRKSDPNIHLNAPFKKKLSGGRPQTPIRTWLRHAQHGASRHAILEI